MNCCKSHLAIIKSVESESMSPEILLKDISYIQYLDDNSDDVTRSLLFIVLHRAREFINQCAVLLPHISKMLCQAYCSDNIIDINIQLDVGKGTITFTSKWLLNQLIVHFQYYMKYECIHKKFGTILYHKGE